MEAKDYLEILQKEIHSVVLATTDEQGHPFTSFMDVMHADETGIYFLTSKGKEIHARMSHCDYVALTGMKGTDYFDSKMCSVTGRMKNIGPAMVEQLFEENPYMKKIYPSRDNRDVIDVFQIYTGQGEFTDFSVQPPVRKSFAFGDAGIRKSGYHITEGCTGCNICVEKCPSHCITTDHLPYVIREENCLHCGNCYLHCPVNAVAKYENDHTAE